MPVNILDRNDVSVLDPQFRPLLNNLQANILKPHGRNHAWHLFIQFIPGKEKLVKKWISKGLAADNGGFITNAHAQLQVAQERKTNPGIDGGLVTNFFLSPKGYERLGFKLETITGNYPFFQSLKQRGPKTDKENLRDPEVLAWEPTFQLEIHAMIMLADNSTKALETRLAAIRSKTKNIFRIIGNEKGEMLRNRFKQAIEHFGYADGISQPLFLADDKEINGQTWTDRMPLNIVLATDPGSDQLQDCFGSFLVFRKLEQNVKMFHQKKHTLTETLFNGNTSTENIELTGAMLTGRFEDGTPVVNNSKPFGSVNKTNDFDYRKKSSETRCPFHAHIRGTNPRVEIPPDLNKPEEFKFIRIVRRGIPYDEVGRNNDLSIHPKKGVGLLFMCFQSNIEQQFERIQKWTNEGFIDGGIRAGIDGIIGQGDSNFKQGWPNPYGNDNEESGLRRIDLFRDVVTMKGGEYFFAPSIPFLRQISELAEASHG